MFLTGLDRVLNDSGVQWTARPGWRTRTAHRGGLREVRAVMWHTTETVTSAFRNSTVPTLGYVTNGLGYNLYNILIGRDGHAYLIAAGTAAHAGKGSGHGMPRDQANLYSFGISFDSNNNTTPVNAAQLETGARLGAAIDREWKNSIRHVMHGEWAPARRSDPTKIPGGWSALRAAINRGYWNTPTTNTTPGRTWLEMVSKSELQSLLRQEGWAYKGRDENRDAYSYLRNTHRMVAAAAGERAGLLEAIRQVAGGTEIDLGAIEKAAEKGVSDALASLEADVTLTINTDQED